MVTPSYLEVPLPLLIAPSEKDSRFQSLAAQFGAKEFHKFMEAWGAIKDSQVKARVLNLIERLADLKC
jgi:hypothetical protein